MPPATRPLPHLIRKRRGHLPMWRRILYAVAGAVLAIAGIVGLLMPGIPGFILLVPGVVLLALVSQMFTRWVNASERWLPERWRRAMRRVAARLPLGSLKRRLLLPRGVRRSS